MDHYRVVRESQAALQATIDFGSKQLASLGWQSAPGSEADREIANTEVGSAGPWGDRPPRTAYAASNLMMTAVLDDLCSLRKILDDTMPVMGPTIVSRSAIEIASTVWWLMEPRIGVRRRVCRELVVSLTSARRAKQVAEGMQNTGYHLSRPEISAAVSDALQQEADVLRRISDLGIAPATGGKFDPKIENEQASNATEATEALLRAAAPINAPPGTVYRVYSAVMHGELYGLMNFMTLGVSSTGGPVLHWHLPPDVLDSTVQITIVAFQQVYQRIAKVLGWSPLPGDLWDAKIRKIYLQGPRGN